MYFVIPSPKRSLGVPVDVAQINNLLANYKNKLVTCVVAMGEIKLLPLLKLLLVYEIIKKYYKVKEEIETFEHNPSISHLTPITPHGGEYQKKLSKRNGGILLYFTLNIFLLRSHLAIKRK
ncbi:hypothetical protein ACJX0J_038952 [Zea mays]